MQAMSNKKKYLIGNQLLSAFYGLKHLSGIGTQNIHNLSCLEICEDTVKEWNETSEIRLCAMCGRKCVWVWQCVSVSGRVAEWVCDRVSGCDYGTVSVWVIRQTAAKKKLGV